MPLGRGARQPYFGVVSSDGDLGRNRIRVGRKSPMTRWPRLWALAASGMCLLAYAFLSLESEVNCLVMGGRLKVSEMVSWRWGSLEAWGGCCPELGRRIFLKIGVVDWS